MQILAISETRDYPESWPSCPTKNEPELVPKSRSTTLDLMG